MEQKLSRTWRVVLSKLSEFGDEGVDQDKFCVLMGDDYSKGSYGRPVHAALSQMFFKGTGYYSVLKGHRDKISITEAGRKALSK